MAAWRGAALVSSAAAALAVAAAGVPVAPRGPLVQAQGTRFVLGADPFVPVGFNQYYMVTYGAQPSQRALVTDVLDDAERLGLNVLRMWAFSEGEAEGHPALQPAPGVYDEEVFRALDWAVDEAAKRGIRVLLVLSNYWDAFGGAPTYVRWAREAGEPLATDETREFFTSPYCRATYMQFVHHLFTRVNHLRGVRYLEDAAIFGWNLMNEPRVPSDPSGDVLYTWIAEMGSHIKRLDPHHLLGLGSEGFWGASTPRHLRENPNEEYLSVGTDFVRHHRLPFIDFASFHLWSDTWLPDEDEDAQLRWVENWVRGHLQAATTDLHKPVVLDEYGKQRPIAERDRFFGLIYETLESGVAAGTAARGGDLLWILSSDQYPDYDGFSVYCPEDVSTCTMLSEHVRRMRAASAAPQLAEAVSRQSYFDALTPMTMAPSFAEYMRRKAEP